MSGNADLISTLEQLISEDRNPNTMDIDTLSAMDVIIKINEEDKIIPSAIEKVLPDIATAVDEIVKAFNNGGRLIYIGAGTSGRLGILDASECPPTFGVPTDQVIGIIAGGDTAIQSAIEGAEDDLPSGATDLKNHHLTDKDIVVGISVSGRTPYVIGALFYANEIGAVTVALSCNPASDVAAAADIAISPIVGPEVLTGSTRLKSGTAQKLVLNMLSTASMILTGKSYQNLMVDLKATNKKLIVRAARIIMQATDCSLAEAEQRLVETDYDVKLAIFIQITGLDIVPARAILQKEYGFLRKALVSLEKERDL